MHPPKSTRGGPEFRTPDVLFVAKPGDQIFFRGQGTVSRTIAFGSCSVWQLLKGHWLSHVGTVFAHEGRLLLGHSTTLATKPCYFAGKCVSGVQAHDLYEYTSDHAGQAWIARLPVYRDLNEHESTLLTRMIVEAMGQPYDAVGAFVSATRVLRRMPWFYESVKHAFCSEFDAWLLKNLGRWPMDSASCFTPARMARDGVRNGWLEPLELVKA